MVFCTQCGHSMEEGKKFCTQCGAPLQHRSSVPLRPQEPEPVVELSPPPAAEAPSPPEEAPLLHATAVPNEAPVPKVPVSEKIPDEAPAIQTFPAQPRIKEEPAPAKPKRNLFPVIFFSILGLCLTVLF